MGRWEWLGSRGVEEAVGSRGWWWGQGGGGSQGVLMVKRVWVVKRVLVVKRCWWCRGSGGLGVVGSRGWWGSWVGGSVKGGEGQRDGEGPGFPGVVKGWWGLGVMEV